PSALAIDPSTGTLWVAWGPNPLGARDNISLVNLTTGEVVGEVPGTANATGLLYVASLNVMFVTQTTRSNGLGRVLFLNATTGAPVASAVPVGIDPAAMAYDPYASLLYVMSNGTGIASSIAFPSGQVDDPYIPVGSNPDSAVYDPASGNIYVANWGSGNITVLNGSTGSPVAPGIGYPGASQPIDLIFDPATGFVYVTFLTQTDAHAAIGWLDPAIDAAVGESEFDNPGIEPAATALDPSTGLFLMPLRYTYGSLGLVTFDPLSESWNFSGVFPPGPVGAYASLEVVDDATQTDYIAHAFDPTSAGPSYLTTVWLRNSSGGPIVLLGASARSGTYDPEDGRVYIADSFTTTIYGSEPDSVAAINASGGPVLSTTPIGYGGIGLSAGYAPQTVGYDPANHELIVVDGGSQYAVELNASTGAYAGQFTTGSYLTSAGTLPNDSASWGSEVAYDPVHGRLYLSGPTGGIVGLYAGNLSTFFGAFAESPVPTEAGWIESLPYQDVAVNPSTGLVYEVAPADLLGGGGTVTVYDPFTTGPNASGKFLLGVHGGGFGSGIAFDPVDSSMYVTDARANVVYVLNASSMANGYTAEEIPVGSDPTAIAFDPDTGSILVADTGSSNVTVLNGSTQPAGLVGAVSLPTAPGPSALIVDPSQDTVLVTSSLVGTVQAISPSPQIYSYSVSRPSTDVGVPVSLATVAVGGVGAPHYHYGDLPPGCTSSDGPTMVCDPTGPGTFSVQLTITDSGPFNTTAARVLTVAPDPSISLTPTSLTVDVGLTFGASVVVANGTGP
ncbi:MAG TPA: hypothetical protein VMH90_00680, partial [Thermoplasmata archaeon]|nr:hypothetical protein [Thermoplasmata archaeon]